MTERLVRIGQVGITTVAILCGVFLALPARASGPLPNGVAAGDVTANSAVLWARVTSTGPVTFEYTTDPGFGSTITTVVTTAQSNLQPVKINVTGLSPATTYYYRLTDANGASGQGHFRTAVSAGTRAGLRFGVSGDWVASLAPYPSISNADARDLDFFVELGDTIGAGSATSVDDFRLKHSDVYSTHHGLNTWADLRASTAMFATIDDNDVRDNFAGGAPPASNPDFSSYAGTYINDTELFSNALRAFQDYNPLQDQFYGNTGDARTANKRKLYRSNTYGQDAAIFMLDTRSFRDEQLAALTSLTDTAAGLDFITTSLSDTTRTLMGTAQLADLKADLLQAQAGGITWKFILIPNPIQNLGPFKAEDRYEGYGTERTELLRFINDNSIDNVVFVTASLHGTLINNLTYQELPPTLPLTSPTDLIHTPVDAFEVVVGPVAVEPPSGPFGPAIVEIAYANGLISLFERSIYYASPRMFQDTVIKQVMNNKILTPMGYDLLGLGGSSIDATLISGDYVAANTYGWTEFDIDSTSRVLTVTTYGIDYYTSAEMNSNPGSITSRTPEVVSQFVVRPKVAPEAVVIFGPTTGITTTSYAFTANVSPLVATTPITFQWQASDQTTTITQSAALTNAISFLWSTTGTKLITVTTQNLFGSSVDTHTVTIEAATVYLPIVFK